MLPPLSPLLSVLFILLVVTMAGVVLLGVHRAVGQARAVRWALALAAWLAFTGALAASGFLSDFRPIPPRFALVLLPALLFVGWSAFSPAVGRAVQAVPPAAVAGAQSFRIGVEGLLFALHAAGWVPALLTFEGRNFDIVPALLAPLVAVLLARNIRGARPLTLAWNVLGIALVVNVAVHGILSTPTPFRVFETVPPTVFLARFPFVWLPGFLVPLALWLHVVSLRQLTGGSRPA